MDEVTAAVAEKTAVEISTVDGNVDSPFRTLLIWLGLPLTLASFASTPLDTLHSVAIMTSPGATLTTAAIAWTVTDYCNMFFIRSQATLLSLCLAWSPGNVWVRFAIYGSAACVCVLCWFIGALLCPWIAEWYVAPQFWPYLYGPVVTHRQVWSRLLQIIGELPMILLTVQLPFWLTRVLFGWKLVPKIADPASTAGRQPPDSLSLKNLLAATTSIAICFGLLQLARRTAEFGAREMPPAEYIHEIIVVSAHRILVLLIAVLPLTFLFLRKYNRHWSWVVTLVFATAGCGVTMLLDRWQSIAAIDAQWILAVTDPEFAYFISLMAAVQLLSARGWQLAKRAT